MSSELESDGSSSSSSQSSSSSDRPPSALSQRQIQTVVAKIPTLSVKKSKVDTKSEVIVSSSSSVSSPIQAKRPDVKVEVRSTRTIKRNEKTKVEIKGSKSQKEREQRVKVKKRDKDAEEEEEKEDEDDTSEAEEVDSDDEYDVGIRMLKYKSGRRRDFLEMLTQILPKTMVELKTAIPLELDFGVKDFDAVVYLIVDMLSSSNLEGEYIMQLKQPMCEFSNGEQRLAQQCFILKVFGKFPSSMSYNVNNYDSLERNMQVETSRIIAAAANMFADELKNELALITMLPSGKGEARFVAYKKKLVQSTEVKVVSNQRILVSSADYQTLEYAVWQYERIQIDPTLTPTPVEILRGGNRDYRVKEKSRYIEYLRRIQEVVTMDTCPLDVPKLIFNLSRKYSEGLVFRLSDLIGIFEA